MYAYQMSWPIDFFGLMVPFKEFYNRAVSNEGIMRDFYENHIHIRYLLNAFLRDLVSKDSYWEGDIRGDNLYIGSLPSPEDSNNYYFIAFKQDNNGTSYIISQIHFVHLEGFLLLEHKKPVSQSMQDCVKSILDKYAPCLTKGENE